MAIKKTTLYEDITDDIIYPETSADQVKYNNTTVDEELADTAKQTDLDNLESRVNDRITSLINNIGRIHNVFKVRFISPVDTVGGRIIAETPAFPDGSAGFPAHPDLTSEGLKFAGWTHTADDLKNIQHDIDVGAIYETISGDTEVEFTLTGVTGLSPQLYFTLDSGTELTVYRSDGNVDTVTASPYTPVFDAHGTYNMRIEQTAGSGSYALGGGSDGTQFFGGSDTAMRGALSKLYIDSGVRLSNSACLRSVNLTSVVIPGSAPSLRATNFQQSGLISIVLPPGTQITGNSAFQQCTDLNYIVFPPGLTSILTGTLRDSGITSVVLPDSLQSMNASVFLNCTGLTSLRIPANVTNIGPTNFAGCTSMAEYIFEPDVPPTLADINVFSGIPAGCKIYVPDQSVDAYKTATNWIEYADQIYPVSIRPLI